MSYIQPQSALVSIGDAASEALIACALASPEPVPRLALLGEATIREAMRKNRIQRRSEKASRVSRLRAEYRVLKAAWFEACAQSEP
jgi:hypothetical protein